MNAALALKHLKDRLNRSARMPVIFIGHGTPMNAIEDTTFNRSWSALGRTLSRPQAIIMISAHWVTPGKTLVDVSARHRTLHDFYGFPDALYAEHYEAPGAPSVARGVIELLGHLKAQAEEGRGLDHGAWTLLKFLYPEADVPVFQLSIDPLQGPGWQLELGQALSPLRGRGVLILGSGNTVHNLSALRFDGQAHDWALAFDQQFAQRLQARDFHSLGWLQGCERMIPDELMAMAHPTLEHYIPSLIVAGASEARDRLYFTTEGFDLGALSMRSFVFHGA